MVRTSVLHDALNNINNAEKSGKRQVLIRPSSKVIIKFLTVMQRHGTFLFCALRNMVETSWVISKVGMITRAMVDTATTASALINCR